MRRQLGRRLRELRVQAGKTAGGVITGLTFHVFGRAGSPEVSRPSSNSPRARFGPGASGGTHGENGWLPPISARYSYRVPAASRTAKKGTAVWPTAAL